MEQTGYLRYAVYWAPEAGSSLAGLGAAWLGWDAEARAPAALAVPPAGVDLAELTQAPRRYGFHATLKPPFSLTPGATLDGLRAALDACVGAQPAFAAELVVACDLGFCALRPAAPCPSLNALAAAAVTQLDRFRAPPTEAELAKRRARPLSSAQDAYLTAWGYPYVLEEFRFHLTLSRRLAPDEEGPVTIAARTVFGPALGAPIAFRDVCLFGDPGGGRPFHLLSRHALSG
ncbi:MAG: DUF1045 domain-containing protein [Pikeienuella sp.]